MTKIQKPLEQLADTEGLGLFRVPFVATIDDVMNAAECSALVDRIEALGPEVATITRGNGNFELNTRVRNNDRAIFDDTALAADLFARLGDAIPATWQGGAVAVGLNERFRAYRYGPGQRFAPHFDGCFRRDEREASEITVMLYLNDGCDGGETAFLDFETKIVPKRGMVLLFQHTILHEGCLVRAGSKYVLRSDVMYRTSR